MPRHFKASVTHSNFGRWLGSAQPARSWTHGAATAFSWWSLSTASNPPDKAAGPARDGRNVRDDDVLIKPRSTRRVFQDQHASDVRLGFKMRRTRNEHMSSALPR